MKKFLVSLLLFFTLLVSGCQIITTDNTTITQTTITTQIPTTTTTTIKPTTTTTRKPTTTTTSQKPTTTTTTRKPTTTTTTQIPTTTTTVIDDFEDYGMEVIEIDLDDYVVTITGIYNTVEEVGIYIYLYDKLPSNYQPKSTFKKSNYTPENKLSCGGDRFYNREGLLPTKSNRYYTECDIDYRGGGRNAKRIVFSNDDLIFYTSDHYESFSILRFV
jgi:guanyl-specific ribonuclease Sa